MMRKTLVDNARALVTDANPTHFRWNPQFLELCGQYRGQPRACQPYRAQTKGKIERPFFYLEQQFLKGRTFASLLDLQYQLAQFEAEDLDVRVHATTQERPPRNFLTSTPARSRTGCAMGTHPVISSLRELPGTSPWTPVELARVRARLERTRKPTVSPRTRR